jgi:hypothetical protein
LIEGLAQQIPGIEHANDGISAFLVDRNLGVAGATIEARGFL